jgi:hypothetical protein
MLFGYVVGLTIPGVFLVGLILLVAGLRWAPGWPADLGLAAGAGVACSVFALINAISGDLSPTIWAAVGIGLMATSTFGFWSLRRRQPI